MVMMKTIRTVISIQQEEEWVLYVMDFLLQNIWSITVLEMGHNIWRLSLQKKKKQRKNTFISL